MLCSPFADHRLDRLGSAEKFDFFKLLDRFTAVGLAQIKRASKEKESWGSLPALSLSLFRLTMSSSFSAHDFDDDTLSVTSTRYQSFIDLSPSSNYHTHTHHSSVGSENSTTPLHPQRSSIRIDTNLMVRKCVSKSLFQHSLINSTFGSFPSLAPTRKTATANNTQTRLAASQKCGITIAHAHTLHFHLRSSDSRRNKSARKARRLGSLAGPSSDNKLSSPARASGTREKNSKVDAVTG